MHTGGPLPWINGRPAAAAGTHDFPNEGLFETCRLRAGRIPLWPWHARRLQRGLHHLGFGDAVWPVVQAEVQAWLQANPALDGVLRLSVAKTARHQSGSLRRLDYRSLPALGTAGLALQLCRWRLRDDPARAGIKHLDRSDQQKAAAEWSHRPEIFDGLLCNARDEVIESTRANLFLRCAGSDAWLTPDLSQQGVAGVMRQYLLERVFPEQALPVCVRPVPPSLLADAEEWFLCNAVRGIMPVTSLDDRRWPVGSTTRRLQQAVEALWA